MLSVAKRLRLGLRRSVAAQALVLTALIAVVQFSLVAGMVESQHDGAHIIDINGAQRMRTQRIAYLARVARSGVDASSWRNELHAAVDSMLLVRRELLERRDISPTAPDARGNTPAGNAILEFASAARAIEENPRDGAAFAYIESHRLTILEIADRTVEARAAIFERRNSELVVGLIVGLCAIFGTMIFAWKRAIEPSERRATDLLARLNDSEAQLRSLFAKNPDSIAIYDRDGRIVRGNGASAELLGAGATDFLGQHFERHIAPRQGAAVSAAFARALAGESVTIDTQFRNARDEAIDVHATLFPNVTDGRIVGVIGIAKDTRALRRAEAAFAAQSERITELYRAFALQNQSWQRQARETLAVAAQRLGYEWAAAVEIVDGVSQAVAVVGDAGFEGGDLGVLTPELVRRAKSASDVWAIDDLANAALHLESSLRAMPWGSVVGVPLVVNGATAGSLVLGSRGTRANALDATDRDFLRLVMALVATSIQRGDQEKKLDALAFFDALTCLPNRVLLAERLGQVLAAASRRDLHFAVHCLDLDRFKAVNDRFGHAIGDEVLRIVARRLEACTRKEDTIARVGGDEFVIVQTLDADGDGAEKLARRIIAAIAAPFTIDGVDHALGISIGISIFPLGGTDQAALLRSADEALLCAKVAGRNRFEFASNPSGTVGPIPLHA